MTGRTPSIFTEARKDIEELDLQCHGCFDVSCLQKCVFCPVEAERQKLLMTTMVVAQHNMHRLSEIRVS
jgi:hypothetical protein